jgi:hypothetical protein
MVERRHQEALSCGGVSFQHGHAGSPNALANCFQSCVVESLLATEIVVEQRLVDAGFLGNLLGARPG